MSTAPAEVTAPLPDDTAAAAAGKPNVFRRILQGDLASVRVIFGLIVIWAISGFGYFWPGWTIFGWGLILALHASLAILRQPITELAVTREQGAELLALREAQSE